MVTLLVHYTVSTEVTCSVTAGPGRMLHARRVGRTCLPGAEQGLPRALMEGKPAEKSGEEQFLLLRQLFSFFGWST